MFTVPSRKSAGGSALSFPNLSRCYEETRDSVRFWGYEHAIEYSFFVTADALRRIHPQLRQGKDDCLSAFDAHRDLICSVAAKVHARGTKRSYDLTFVDF